MVDSSDTCSRPTTQGPGLTINRTRTITFGLMATPAKPQPRNPVGTRSNWPPSLRGSKGPSQSSLALLGNSMYWGTVANDAGMYPWNHNYSLWRYFGLLKGGKTAGDFIEDGWLANFRRLCLEGGNHSGGSTGSDRQSLTCSMQKKGGDLRSSEGQLRGDGMARNL